MMHPTLAPVNLPSFVASRVPCVDNSQINPGKSYGKDSPASAGLSPSLESIRQFVVLGWKHWCFCESTNEGGRFSLRIHGATNWQMPPIFGDLLSFGCIRTRTSLQS